VQKNDAAEINEFAPEFLRVAGVNLEVRRYEGIAAGLPTLIFLHEGLGCVDMWRDFPGRLVQLTGCPAFVYSRRGYGRSDACSLPRDLRFMHDEALDVLPEVINAAGIESHILIGHSDGASIALISAGAAATCDLAGAVSMAPHVFCEELSVQSIRAARTAFQDGDLRSRLAKYHFENVDCAFWGWNDVWLNPEFIHWNIEEFLPGITVPQLILQGENDQYGTAAQVEAIKKQSGGGVTVHMLADCGHSPYREQANQSVEAISTFVNSLTAARQ
jgi:pimeloyl-ACP methyl ester carboxylesterase